MKKQLISVLLVLTMLFSMVASVMPAYATESTVESEISFEFVSDIIVYDFETGTREDGEGNEYTVYDWFVYGRSNVIVNSESYGYENQPLGGSPINIFMRCFVREIVDLYGIDTQETTPWEVGNTYDAQIYYSYYLENDELYEDTIDVKVSVVEVSTAPDFEITSEITVTDENLEVSYDGEQIYPYFDWSQATVNAVIGGTEYTDVTPEEAVAYYADYRYEQDEKDKYFYFNGFGDGQSATNIWLNGNTYDAYIKIGYHDESFNNAYYLNIPVKVKVESETDLSKNEVVSVTAEPLTYAEHERRNQEITFTATLENGLIYTWSDMDIPLPSEVGEHTLEVGVFDDRFTVTVSVTVTKSPRSGVWAEGFTWVYDKDTYTLYLKGQGELPHPTANGYYGLTIRHLVIDEGIESIAQWALPFSSLQTLVLPKSLKSLPAYGMFDGCDIYIDKLIISEGLTQLTHYPLSGAYVSAIYLPTSITVFDTYAVMDSLGVLYGCELNVYYAGTQEQWEAVTRTYYELRSIYLQDGTYDTLVDEFGYPANRSKYVEVIQNSYVVGLLFYEEIMDSKATVNVVWLDEDGNEVDFEEVTVGGNATKTPEVPEKEGYTGKWDKVAENVVVSTVIRPVYTEKIIVDNGTATIPDSIVDITEDQDAVIDVTESEEQIDSVLIGTTTVDKITDANVSVSIKLPDVTVSFDKDAMGSIGEQAGDNDVTIVAKGAQEEDLTEEQKQALSEKDVHAILNLEAYAGENKITEFGGGKVTVSVPFSVPEGKEGTDYFVAYIADDGSITVMETAYENGYLSFETTHFSKYVVLEKSTCDGGHTDENGDFVCDTCEKLFADVNMDGVLNIDDVNELLIYLSGQAQGDALNVDVNNDGFVNIDDLNFVLVALATI